jgi:hypothetical protein
MLHKIKFLKNEKSKKYQILLMILIMFKKPKSINRKDRKDLTQRSQRYENKPFWLGVLCAYLAHFAVKKGVNYPQISAF